MKNENQNPTHTAGPWHFTNEPNAKRARLCPPRTLAETSAALQLPKIHAAHTALPWKLDHTTRGTTAYISTKTDNGLILMSPHSAEGRHDFKANAELIVRAVNSHAELLAALKGMLSAFAYDWRDTVAQKGIESLPGNVRAAVEAVAKAEGA